MPIEVAAAAVYLFVQYLVAGVAIGVIVLMLVRLALNYADVNPFSRPVIYVRRLSDPLVNPVRRGLLQFGFGPNVTPLVVILITIVLGWFVLQLAESIINMVVGVVVAVRYVRVVAVVGWLLYGFLDIYALLIVIRIVFSWGNVSYANRLMRFLVNATDPLLVPLRRVIPPLGVFDISALVALLLLWMLKTAVRAVLLGF
ncbi:MAG TPA: YggT family protein [Pyrinomonadaceae bacterium]|jgi:YggT family protein